MDVMQSPEIGENCKSKIRICLLVQIVRANDPNNILST